MIINTTISVDQEINNDWLTWMKDVYVSNALSSGLLIDSRIVRILAEEEGGKSYAIQMRTKDKASYDKYIGLIAPRLNELMQSEFNGKVAMFSTILEVVHEARNDG